MKTLLSVAITLALALGGWVFRTNSKLDVLQDRHDREVGELQSENKMLWSYTGWLYYQLNVLRTNDKLPIVDAPKMEK